MDHSIQFKHLAEIELPEIVHLLNHPGVRALMPLAAEPVDAASARAWVESKESCWTQYPYGPYAIVIGGSFAGWGGLQPENGEPNFALVLLPEYWGMGKAVFRLLLREIARNPEIPAITVHFPELRKNRNAIERLGFVREETVLLEGQPFIRYRLTLAGKEL